MSGFSAFQPKKVPSGTVFFRIFNKNTSWALRKNEPFYGRSSQVARLLINQARSKGLAYNDFEVELVNTGHKTQTISGDIFMAVHLVNWPAQERLVGLPQ